MGSYSVLWSTKVIYKQQNPVLMIVLFCFVKEIFCTCNPIVSICLRLLNYCTQLMLSGRQYIARIRWVCWICDLTSWILKGVSSYEYLLVLDMLFIIQKEYIWNPLQTKAKKQSNFGSKFIQRYRGNKNDIIGKVW